MTEKNTSIRTKTRHPADFLTYIAIYVQLFPLHCFLGSLSMYLPKVSGV